jgi:hypothetical protein
MRTVGLPLMALAAALVVPSGHASAQSATRTLVFQFGFNTKVASSGNGTGTETIVIGPASDGGVTIKGTDEWWNTVRPRATNTCELHPNGGVSCTQAPYALSPIQLTLFPLLAQSFFDQLNSSGTSSWKHSYKVKAAIVPGASGFAGNLYTWDCAYQLQGKGLIPKSKGAILVQTEGTLTQQGGRYLKATSKQRISYDARNKVVLAVSDTRSHLPQRSVYNNDLVQAELIKDSQPHVH